MRSLRSATCTSGDPVSLSWVLYVPIIPVFRSLLNATAVSSTYGRDLTRAARAPDRRMLLNRLPRKTYYLKSGQWKDAKHLHRRRPEPSPRGGRRDETLETS